MGLFLFPFELIEKGSAIALYGAGNVGLHYVNQISRTGYCEIVCVVDKNHDAKGIFPLPVNPPEALLGLEPCPPVLLALATSRHIEEVRDQLRGMGIPEEKIIVAPERFVDGGEVRLVEQGYSAEDSDQTRFSICITALGGLGDTLLVTTLAKELRRLFALPLRIDMVVPMPVDFIQLPFLNAVHSTGTAVREDDYDVVMTVRRFAFFKKIDWEKTRRFSPVFYDYCRDSLRTFKECFRYVADDFQFAQYCRTKEKNRVEQCNANGVLNLDRNTPTYMEWDSRAFDLLFKCGLESADYITVCNSIESRQSTQHPKLWPKEHFENLLAMIRREYPELPIVYVGDSYNFGRLENVDLDLVGKTTPDEVKVILKYSRCLISVEGGLLHLMHFLNGRAIALFGPTLPDFYGYRENVNIRTTECPSCVNGCEWLTRNWQDGCAAFGGPSRCMTALSPETVLASSRTFLDAPTKKMPYSVEKIVTTGSAKATDRNLHGILRDLAFPGVTMAQVYREKSDIALAYHQHADRIVVYDRDMSMPDQANPPPNFLFGQSVTFTNVRPEYGFIYNIPAMEDHYDLLLNFTLDGASRPQLALREFLRVTRPGGRIVVAVSKDSLADAIIQNSVTCEIAPSDRRRYEFQTIMVIRKES